MEFTIAKATPEDAPAIHGILTRWLLYKTPEADRANGFLISGFTEQDYARFASECEYFFKAMDGDRIAGVVVACESSHITPEDAKNSLLKYSLNKPFVLVKQVFIAPDYGGCNVGSQLYNHLFRVIPQQRPVVAVIVMEPMNVTSCRFHARRGFSEYLDFTPDRDPDGVAHKRSAWIRPARTSASFLDDVRLTNVHDRESDIGEIMSDRLGNFVDLYRHEDNLNWTKIGMQCTILFALIAAAAFFFNKKDSITEEMLAIFSVVGVCGIVVNMMFMRKIESGIEYMHHYKKRIMEYDKVLSFYYPKVTPIFDEGSRMAGKSITCRLFVPLSRLCVVVWVLVTAYLVFCFLGALI